MDFEKIEKLVYELLCKNNMSYCEMWRDKNRIAVQLCNGDWKHEHLFLNHIMTRKFPQIKSIQEQEIGHSLDDCYSSIHWFVF